MKRMEEERRVGGGGGFGVGVEWRILYGAPRMLAVGPRITAY